MRFCFRSDPRACARRVRAPFIPLKSTIHATAGADFLGSGDVGEGLQGERLVGPKAQVVSGVRACVCVCVRVTSPALLATC